MLIKNGVVFTGTEFRTGWKVRLQQNIISEACPGTGNKTDESVINLEGDYLLPGFVDVHIHGFMGRDTMRGEDDIRGMSRDLAKTGTAAFCPTTMSAAAEETEKVIAAVRRVMQTPEAMGARVLGAHMEAPYLSAGKAGAQRAEFFLDPDWEQFQMMVRDPAAVRLITLAPERKGSEAFIRKATEAGIHVSIGHTEADAETVHCAADAGADHITHTFNAQTPLHHRKPGVPGAAMTDDRLYCEMICDGIHLHDDIVKLLVRCKGSARAVAITDAMEAAGMPDGKYSLGGQTVLVRNGAARLENDTLAGSVLTMKRALERLIHHYAFQPAEACAMCTSTPAESIGETKAGHMIPGSPAILTRWSRDWKFKSVITEKGEICQPETGMV